MLLVYTLTMNKESTLLYDLYLFFLPFFHKKLTNIFYYHSIKTNKHFSTK